VPVARIAVTNFKSFRDIDVSLGDLTVLVGANGSGKSNFINIFRFLRDINHFGLENAVSLQGGTEYLRNVSLRSSVPLTVEVTIDDRPMLRRPTRRGPLSIIPDRTVYRFALTFHKRGSGYRISDDSLTQLWRFYLGNDPQRAIGTEPIGTGTMNMTNERGKIRSTLTTSPDLADIAEDLMPRFYRSERGAPGALLLEQPYLGFAGAWHRSIEGTAIYDIDPKLPKKAVPVTGKLDLEEDGSNLAIVLNTVLTRKASKAQLVNMMADLLPFVENVGIEKFADTSVLFKVSERYGPRQSFPASLISDGTINVTALVLALFFERSMLTFIEEPERNLHPHLISKVVGMMQDAASRKQIIASTHHPDLIAHARLENLLLFSRNDEGFTQVSRPAESKRVRAFLEAELGVERLFSQNLLKL
jgi:ABC-type polar amino acid transport system ATPase subunit